MSRLSPLATTFLVIGGFALLLEIFATLAEGRTRREKLPLLRVMPDAIVGYRPVPNDVHFAYDQRVRLNAAGLRGADIDGTGKPAIVVLGETQTYGLGIGDAQLVTALLQKKLAARGRDTRVINAAVRAYTLGQSAAMLRQISTVQKPEHVIVMLYPFAIRGWQAPDSVPADTEAAAWMLDLGGPATRARLARWRLVQAFRRSAAVAWLWYRVKRWRAARGFWGALLDGPDNPRAARAYAAAGLAADDIAATSRALDATLTFVSIPPPENLDAGSGAGFRDWVAEIAQRHNAGYVDMRATLKNLQAVGGRLPTAPYDDHYDAAAHAAMADVLARSLPGAD